MTLIAWTQKRDAVILLEISMDQYLSMLAVKIV